jgi:hypothetical protein
MGIAFRGPPSYLSGSGPASFMRRQSCFKRMSNSMANDGHAANIAARIRAAGERARAEADARRESQSGSAPAPKEIGGPKAPEPTRYGDWERKGVASDF